MRLFRNAFFIACFALFSGSTVSADELKDVDLAAIGPYAPILAPRLQAEIAGARIGWQIGDIRGAFREAAADGKPVIVVAEGDDGGLFANVLRCPTINTLAGRAHFILVPLPIQDESSDAGRLINALHMDSAFKSTLAVLETKDRHLNELARMTGYQREADILARLSQIGLTATSPSPLALAKLARVGEPPRDCAR